MVGGCFMLFIGIDLGTSAVKLLLMNENGGNSQNRFKGISLFSFRIPVGRSKTPTHGLKALFGTSRAA